VQETRKRAVVALSRHASNSPVEVAGGQKLPGGPASTATEDEWIVSEGENTIFALFARTDYRDYYESEGGQAHVSWSPGSDFELRGGARVESHRSLSVRTRVSLTGRHPVFRPNPPIQDGDEQAFTAGFRLGPVELPVQGGTHGEATYERSGPPLNGDFEYGRVRGAVRHRSRLSPKQDFRARLIAGSTLTGTLPAQKIWYVGGIGTLRGHDFKSFAGDQFFLANAEIYQRARKNIYAFTFLDCGAAWFGSENLDRQRPALALGEPRLPAAGGRGATRGRPHHRAAHHEHLEKLPEEHGPLRS